MDKTLLETGMKLYEEKKYKEAAKYLLQCQDTDDSVVMFRIGVLYTFGYGVDKDDTIASKWFIKSAEKGYPNAQHNLAINYKNGSGVEQSAAKMVYWHTEAAKNGFVPSQYKLAFYYYSEKEYSKALPWVEMLRKSKDVELWMVYTYIICLKTTQTFKSYADKYNQKYGFDPAPYAEGLAMGCLTENEPTSIDTFNQLFNVYNQDTDFKLIVDNLLRNSMVHFENNNLAFTYHKRVSNAGEYIKHRIDQLNSSEPFKFESYFKN